ncbi:MAG: choice-of-anchor Q domain-containing protein [Dokdonella sp.]
MASTSAFAAQRASATPSLPAISESTAAPATITVFNCTDAGIGSLRIAIGSAVSGDTIDLSQLTCSTITLTSGALAVDVNALTLKGSSTHRVTIDAGRNTNHYDRAIKHTGTGILAINDLSIANAKYEDGTRKGGCIYSSGSVYLTRSTVTNCTTIDSAEFGAQGGGVYTHGNFKMVNSTVSNSLAVAGSGIAFGGGVFANGNASVTYSTIENNQTIANDSSSAGGLYARGDTFIESSTISNNQSANAAGVDLAVGSQNAEIVGSTFSGNIASQFVAAISAGCKLDLTNSTIAFNTAGHGGGAVYLVANSTLRNTIIVGNTNQSNGFESDFLKHSGVILTASKNLVGISASSLFPPGSGTLVGSGNDLTPLADNGGSTRTHAPVHNSQAVNGGGATIPTYDQRGVGFPRSLGTAVDIGSIEFDPDLIFVNGFN